MKVCKEESKKRQRPLNSILATLKHQVRFSRDTNLKLFHDLVHSPLSQHPSLALQFQHHALFNAGHQPRSLTESSNFANYQNVVALLQVQEYHPGSERYRELSSTCSSQLSRFAFTKISTTNYRIQQEASHTRFLKNIFP